ncbi:unnamed protein product [Hymenolepis diminuta]|uniref:Innexin n=1 Tax=Hymenolepis diminuta TaxID=6216 RepID=A0A0R3SB77_HYMDI|nr:unnamed protein product [Hymenolepis diminuta]
MSIQVFLNLFYLEKRAKKSSSGKSKHSISWPLCKRLLSCCHRNSQYHRKRYSSKHRRSLQGCCSRESGNFLTTFYCLVKCLYLINAVGQIYLMERFVGARVTFYGAAVLADLIRGRDWQQSGHFPRVTFCDMEAKKLGKNHLYTIQCVLPINMFLEKIYIFLWFWHIMLTIVTITSLVGWLKRLFWCRSRVKFVRHYLKVVNALPPILEPRDRQRTRQFVEEYLTPDAFFLIRLIGANSGDLLASELTHQLWLSFIGRAVPPIPLSSSTPLARLCPKHAICSCDSCYFGGSRYKSYGSSKTSESRLFGVKYYPGDRSPSKHKIGPSIFQQMQMCADPTDHRHCDCEDAEEVSEPIEKSISGKSNGNNSEDIV